MVREKTLWEKIKGKLSVVPSGCTPPNWKYIGLMFISLFGSAYSVCFLFPFLPEMVLSFGYTEEEKGYYVGLIASSLFAGRAVGSYFWGYLSDVKGRRLVLLICIFGNGLFSLFFGFSTNLAMAITFRFASGAFNGIVGTAKAVLYEVSDDSNQAIGMSTLSLSWGFGLIVGPSLGGWLASPNKKYPNIFGDNWFLETYQYFLPCAVCFIVSTISFIIVFFCFEETFNKKDLEITIEDGDPEVKSFIGTDNVHKLRSVENLKCSMYPAISVEDLHNEAEAATFLVVQNLKKEDLSLSRESLHVHHKLPVPSLTSNEPTGELHVNVMTNLIGANNGADEDNEVKDYKIRQMQMGEMNGSGEQHVVKENYCRKKSDEDVTIDTSKRKSLKSRFLSSTPVTIMRTTNIRDTILLYTVYSFGVIGFEDVFAIWASTETRLDGLGFDTSEIGTCIASVAIPLLILQIKFYPLIVKKFGVKQSFILFNIVIMIAVQIIPILHLIHDRSTLLWTFLILILLCQKLGVTCCFSGSAILINNSCLPDMIGTANGMGMTMTAIARTLAPTIGGSLFAWSVSYGSINIGPPLDVNITFVFMGVVFFASCIMCILLPSYLNKQRKPLPKTT